MSFISLFILALGLNAPSLAHTPEASISAVQVAERPSNLGYPRDGTRRGGGSRGGVCELASEVPPLTALMPDTATWTGGETLGLEEVVFSLTQRSSPTLWIYLPYTLENPSQLQFTLKDTAGNQLVRSQLVSIDSLTDATPSIIQVSLKDLDISLLPDVDYHWYVTVRCDQGPPVVVDGWLRHQVSRRDGDPDAGFLIDDLLSLAAEVSKSDLAAQMAWQELLDAVGLADISAAPIVDCCRFVEVSQN